MLKNEFANVCRELMQEPAYFRQMEGLYQACFISFEYQLHLMPGSLVAADTQKRCKQKNPLKTMEGWLLAKTRTPSLSRCALLTVYFGG